MKEKSNRHDRLQLHAIEKTILSELEKYGLKSLIVGLSGGADSTSLLRALTMLRSELLPELQLTAVHCNFHLRGSESERDEQFCRALCARLAVDLRVRQCPVDIWRETHTGSDEIACREMRYERFRMILQETGSDAIAVAHNADDQVETFLLNLMRGAGTTGLSGMKPLNNRIFRPLLTISRTEIIRYLDEIGQEYVTDSTNLESLYRRNFLRNRVIPLLEEEWPEAKKSILKSTEILTQERNVLEGLMERIIPAGCVTLSRDSVLDFDSPDTLFFHFLSPYGGSSSLAREIAETIRLPYAGRRWNLAEGYILWEERSGWTITTPEAPEVPRLITENFSFSEDLMNRIRRAPNSELWIEEGVELEWRKWELGDRIHPLGMKGSRLVSDILTEGRIPNHRKENFHVLALPASNEVIWIPTLKRSRKLLVTNADVIRITLSQHT